MNRKLTESVDNQCPGLFNKVSKDPYQCQSNRCVCVPRKECDPGVECGFQDDGCGGKVACGEPTLPDADTPNYHTLVSNWPVNLFLSDTKFPSSVPVQAPAYAPLDVS